MTKAVVIIPARYASSRFPGKPLTPILGKPMVIWVAELSEKAVGRNNVYVATDDERIANVINSAGFKAVMTSEDCLTGTDRLAEAAQKIEADIYINVQGDEPIINPEDINRAIQAKKDNMHAITNGFCWLSQDEDPNSVDIPKVITTENNQLIYMSRSSIPGFKADKDAPSSYKKQVCIYAFTKDELMWFSNFGRKSRLEACEDIEILRFLESDKSIIMYETSPGSLAVDKPEDVLAVESAIRKEGYEH